MSAVKKIVTCLWRGSGPAEDFAMGCLTPMQVIQILLYIL